MLKIALTKGRIERGAVELLTRAGYGLSQLRDPGRRLIFDSDEGALRLVLAKANDVVTYVGHGVCELGVVGRDTILETGAQCYEVADLGFGKCSFALAGVAGRDFFGGYEHHTVATKYPNVAKNYFSKLGMDVKIVKIDGSVELAPLLGLADAIVDIVETGSTLRENGLEVYERIEPVSARLIVNIAAMKLRREEIGEFVERLKL